MTLSTPNRETQQNQRKNLAAEASSFTQGVEMLFAGPPIERSELRRRESGGPSAFLRTGNRPHSNGLLDRGSWRTEGLRGSLNRLLLAAVTAVALACTPQAAFAQHGGGGHGGGGSGHFGGGGHFRGFGGSRAPASGAHSSGSPSGAAVRPAAPPMGFGHNSPAVISHGVLPSSFAGRTGPARDSVPAGQRPFRNT
jgi:hypothetical protein